MGHRVVFAMGRRAVFDLQEVGFVRSYMSHYVIFDAYMTDILGL